jgi:hypothetical protein
MRIHIYYYKVIAQSISRAVTGDSENMITVELNNVVVAEQRHPRNLRTRITHLISVEGMYIKDNTLENFQI